MNASCSVKVSSRQRRLVSQAICLVCGASPPCGACSSMTIDVVVARERGDDAVDGRAASACGRKRATPTCRAASNALGELHRLLHDDAVGEDADIAAALEVAQLAEHPRVDRLVGEVRLAGLAEAQIDRAVLLLGALARRLRDLGRVARRDDLHVRDRAGDGDVLLRVVGAAEVE